MNKIVSALFPICVLIGLLIVGVGVMSVFLNFQYIQEIQQMNQDGQRISVVIADKGISRSGAGTSGHTTHYFHLNYLGDDAARDVTMVYPTTEEFEAHEKGDRVEVMYDPQDPSEAYLEKTPQQIQRLRLKPFMLIGFGLILTGLSVILGKRFEKTKG